MEQINKEVKTPRFTNKKYILLGIRNDNEKIWLEQASFDCNWYYGFGYLGVINQKGNDINEHYHFESFYTGKKNAYDEFKEQMSSCVLSENKLWQLLDLMASFYSLKKTYTIYHSGSNIYTTIKDPNLKDPEKAKMILKDQRKIILAAMKLLSRTDIPIISDPFKNEA